ncbi:hypothetical protein ACQ86N_42880 [Puia sp. P3]|uniref:hypothetical protein n=1 Tax=Puia sp. P3 TaxID=3423952 RepID=UPI003D6660B6
MRPLIPLFLPPIVLLACHSAPAPVAGLTSASMYTFDSVRIAAVAGDDRDQALAELAGIGAHCLL